jgi:hypothetical protein
LGLENSNPNLTFGLHKLFIMSKYISVLILLLIASNTLAQGVIEGKVFDAVDKLEIPYVNIISSDDKVGTASYSDGSFTITIQRFPTTLIFSHVNYGKTEVTFTKSVSDKDILLTPLVTTLDEVVINAGNPINIVSVTYEHLLNSTLASSANGFYRQWTKNDNTYSELLESFYSSKITSKGIEFSKVTQGRYAVKEAKEKGLMAYKNFSVFTNTFPVIQTTERSFLHPLRKNAEDFFIFKITKVINGNNSQKVSVISFEPKNTNNLPAFKGLLYIDDDYNLVRFKGIIEDERFKPLGTIDAAKVKDLKLEVDFFCDNKMKDVLLLNSIKIDLTYKYRYDDKHYKSIHTSSFYFVYEKNDYITNQDLASSEPNDYAAISNSTYDETFWEKKNVLSHTPIEKEIIKQFKKSKLFNQIFKN